MISQWCATPAFPVIDVGPPGEPEEPGEVSGHVVCKMQRWHDDAHADCCWGAAEKESWACTCTCHKEKSDAA